MIPTFEILPGKSIGPIDLGMSQEEVKAALQSYIDSGLDQTTSPTSDYAFGNSLVVEYGRSGGAQFIGASYYNNCGCEYIFQGRHVSSYSAESLFELLAGLNQTPDIEFDEYQYFFSNIGVTVWNADSQYDYLNGEETPVFGQMGVVNDEYAKAIEAQNKEADPSGSA